MGQTGVGAAGKEFTQWFAENGRIGADYNERKARFSPDLGDASSVLLASFRTGLSLVTKHSTLPEKNQLVARFNTVASDLRSVDRAIAQTLKNRQALSSQLAQLEKPSGPQPVRTGADAFQDPKPASRCRA